MKKKLILLLAWLAGAPVFAQSIQGQGFSNAGVDGQTSNLTTNYVLPQVAGTPLMQATATITPQVSNWFSLNGQQALLMEFTAIGYLGNYVVQVSNNISTSSTPGPNYYVAVQDNCIVATPGPGAQTLNWAYQVRTGWKYVRVVANPSTSNTGTLNIGMRVFGPNNTAHSFIDGVPYAQSANMIPAANYATPSTGYAEYKLPYGAHGVELVQNVTTLTAAATPTLKGTLYSKDPQSGQIVAVGTPVSVIAAGNTIYEWTAGAAGTASANINYFTFPTNQDIVFQWTATQTGAALTNCTFSVTAIPLF